jgi:hypothetical protein
MGRTADLTEKVWLGAHYIYQEKKNFKKKFYKT